MKEATVTVNGVTLSHAESMTMRVALEHFSMDLSAPNCLGTGVGEDIRKGYLAAIDLIRNKIFQLTAEKVANADSPCATQCRGDCRGGDGPCPYRR